MEKGMIIVLNGVSSSGKSTLAKEITKLRPDFFAFSIDVHCPDEELASREKARGDRQIGQAIAQLSFVHQQEYYDVEVNTYTNSIAECAPKNVDRLESDLPLTGFKKSMEACNFR